MAAMGPASWVALELVKGLVIIPNVFSNILATHTVNKPGKLSQPMAYLKCNIAFDQGSSLQTLHYKTPVGRLQIL